MGNGSSKNARLFVREVIVFGLLAIVLSAGLGIMSWYLTQNEFLGTTIFKVSLAVLILWWFLLGWRLKMSWLLTLQEYLAEYGMLPFHFERIKSGSPWSLNLKQSKLLRTCATEYQNLLKKSQDSAQTLEKYVGAGASQAATKKTGQSELGGELRKVYVLFSDIRGFTHMTEILKPEETVDILNRMFTAMEEVIAQHGGDINKYIGDAIFAYFRRPYGNEEAPAGKVLRAALRMQDKFESLNARFRVSYSKPVEIGLGIGITAGEAIVGNLGSSNRMEFTLIGDTVNMASRLCGIAKHGQILVNEDMAQVTQNHFELVALPPVQIKGKAGMVTPYTVSGERLNMSR